MLKVNDRKVKGNDEIAELFNEHFVSIGEKLAKEIDPVDRLSRILGPGLRTLGL